MDYHERFDAGDQTDAEELIATLIHEHEYADDAISRPSEEDCAELGRKILFAILERFRGDLIEEGDEVPLDHQPIGESFECRFCSAHLHFPSDEFTSEELVQQLSEHRSTHEWMLPIDADPNNLDSYFKTIG